MDYSELIENLKNLETIAYGYNINGEVFGMDCSDFEQIMVDAADAIAELNQYKELGSLDRLRELVEADREGTLLVIGSKIEEAARLMGYEVIENNIPAPECGSREISHLITGDELLRQTAEEAVELAQAALKVIRAAKGTTPLDGEDAVDMLVEEIADVQNCIAVLSERLPGLQDKANKISAEKMKRWKERLR